jgi:hypothetical protein
MCTAILAATVCATQAFARESASSPVATAGAQASNSVISVADPAPLRSLEWRWNGGHSPYDKIGFQSPSQATNALLTAKRMFRRHLTDIVRDTVQDEGAAEEEIRGLKAALAGVTADRT